MKATGISHRTLAASLSGLAALLILAAAPTTASAASYRLYVTKTGTGSGTVNSSPSGISCGSDCSSRYDGGTRVTLTAVASSGSTFAGWSGDCTGTTASAAITMRGRATCTATFNKSSAPAPVTLSVTKSGTGSGTVTSTPAGISCGATCSASYAANTSVTLTAAPAAGSVFSGWAGQCAGTAASSTLTLSANAACTATFAPAPVTQYTLYVSPTGSGAGTVTSSPAGISCGSACSASYAANTVVTLTAAAATGSSFAGWSGSCAGTGASAQVTVNANTTCVPAFNTVTPPPSSAAPVVLYTDIVSGPNTGGENNKGIYLSIFGKNFGSAGLGSTTRVFINNAEVDNYRYLGTSKGRGDIQQITVQIGALANPPQGTPLPIRVSVNGVDSNADQTFTVIPGNIYFVDNKVGVDTATTSTGGTFTAPFRTVQRKAGGRLTFAVEPASVSGAWGRVRAGDFIVMRGTGTAWTDAGYLDYFMMALNKSGCPIGVNCAQGGGVSSGPITLMGYPGEDVFINGAYNPATDMGTISSADSARILQGMGAWINIVGLRIEGGNHDGAVNTQAGGNNWRVVNNELTCATAVNNASAKGGGIAGDAHVGTGPGQFFLGNHIHDVYNGADNANSNFENHGIYIDGSGTYEIAYNLIRKIRGGNGIQAYANGTNGNDNVDNVNFHHNVIQDTGKHGINIADGSRNGFRIWNNVVTDTDRAGLRFNTTELVGAKVYNNTFYNTNRIKNSATAALMNDANFGSNAIDMRNNIFVPVYGAYYTGTFTGVGPVTNNLWSGGTGGNPAASFSSASLQSDPVFVSTASRDLRLQAASPAVDKGTSVVSGVVKDDFDVTAVSRTVRPMGAGWDIGAFER